MRPELRPPSLDAEKVALLARLAARLDGVRPGQGDDDLAAFHRLAGTTLPMEEFQGISRAENHEDWVRRLLYRQILKPIDDLTREEMMEIVTRASAVNGHDDYEFYLEFFQVNCKHASGLDLIFWPDLVPDLPKDREPTVEEIANLALGLTSVATPSDR